MKSTITPPMNKEERELITAFVTGYVKALGRNKQFYEGYDEFYSYNDKWDINIHTSTPTRNTVAVVAHPQSLGDDGYIETEMSQWVEIAKFDYQGNPKRRRNNNEGV